MKILYIDTSSSFLYSAIMEDDVLVSFINEELGHDMSKNSLAMVSKMFDECNLVPSDIDKIIVVNGPGSFTGIRVGLTFAKVFAWGLNKEITTISSLEAMACSASGHEYYIPVINARRGFVYSGIYDKNLNEILSPCHIKLDDLYNHCKGLNDYVFITNDNLDLIGDVISYIPNFEKIINKFSTRESINPHVVNPNYLKLTEAEENNVNDRRN